MHSLKRMIKVAVVKTKRKLNKETDTPISEYETEAVNICRRLIKREDSEFLICPVTGKRYIENKTLQMFVIIQEKSVSLVNHVYKYDIAVCNKSFEKIKAVYDGHVEVKRSAMEKEILSNVKHSLETMYEKVQNEKVYKEVKFKK